MDLLSNQMNLLRLVDFTDKIASRNNSYNALHRLSDSILTRLLAVEFLGKAFRDHKEVVSLKEYIQVLKDNNLSSKKRIRRINI